MAKKEALPVPGKIKERKHEYSIHQDDYICALALARINYTKNRW
jgi:hypothetical protein